MAQDIADTVDVCPEIPILEVGPGMGVLTQFLLPKERNVKVVELDYESVAYLREAYPQLEDNIIVDVFLKMNLQRLFDGQPFVLTGNYPYNISSQIFFEQENLRLVDQTARNCHALLLTARKRVHMALLVPLQVHQLQHLPDFFGNLLLRQLLQLQTEGNVQLAGYAVESMTKNGFGGAISNR